MHQHHVGLNLLQHCADGVQNLRGHVKQRLPLLHNRQVIFRYDPEGIQHHIQHLPMLAGYAYHRFDSVPLFQFLDQRAHFYCLRAGAEHQHNGFHL